MKPRVVFLAAIMDLCHQGHINLLRRMRATGRKVIVILHDDQSCYDIKGKIPIQDIHQRVENLRITGLVDGVMVTRDTDPAGEFKYVIDKYPDCVYMRSDETDVFPGKWMLDRYGVPIIYAPHTRQVSSSSIRRDLENAS